MATKKAATAGKKPGYQIEFRRLADLRPYGENARTHSPEQVAEIAASIAEFGWTNPILADGEGMIVAGHGRRLAAITLFDRGALIRLPSGEELPAGVVPVIDCTGWSAQQKRAYILTDNQIALNADWDLSVLKGELTALRDDGFDLALTGFSDLEVLRLTGANGGLADPDDVPDLPEVPVSQPGDVWIMGSHRLVCGDATKADDVARCLNGVKPHLMVTDPPYGVGYDPAWRKKAGVNKSKRMGAVMNDDRSDWRDAWALFPGGVAYVWHGALHAATVAGSLEAAGFAIRSQIIWAKDRLVLGRSDYHWQHEPCWYAVRVNEKGQWAGDRKQTTLWSIASKGQDAATVHSTQKPVECMKRPIENNSSPGQAVYEPFCGSGTTIIAAEMTGRSCHAIELNPAYVDVAVKRWQAFTGRDALLDGDGRSFSALQAERK